MATRAGLEAQPCCGLDTINGNSQKEGTSAVGSLKGQKGQRAVTAALDAWFHEVQRAGWRNSAEVERRYATASIVSADRVVFNIKGNHYRLVAAIDRDSPELR